MDYWHLAQINVARALGPADSERMAGFHAQIPAINALADASPGFVWRLQESAGDATAIQANDDPYILVNMSVWENLEVLRDFVYRSAHVGVFRDRSRWFDKPAQAHQAFWWIPAGHVPALDEGQSRLEWLRASRPGPMAFTFAHSFPAPDAPDSMSGPAPQLYEGRRFRVVSNSGNGDVGPGQLFDYRQSGAHVWCVYGSAEARFGSLVAAADVEGVLDARYQQLDRGGLTRTGSCRTTPEVLPDGRLRLYESWQLTSGDRSRGESILEEVQPTRATSSAAG